MLGERTAEEIKIEIGSAFPLKEECRPRSAAATWSPACRRRRRPQLRGDPPGARGAGARRSSTRQVDARQDAARARRRHHGPRHRAHRRRRAAARPRRAAAPRDRDAGPRRRGARCNVEERRGRLRRSLEEFEALPTPAPRRRPRRPDRGQQRRPGRPGARRVTRTTATVLLLVDPTPSSAAASAPAWRSASCRAAASLGGAGRSTSSSSTRRRRQRGRHRRHVGQRGRRAVRRGRADRPGHRGLQQPARDLAARGDQPFVDFGSLDLVGVVVPSGTSVRPRRRRPPDGTPMSLIPWRRSPCSLLLVAVVLQVSLFPHLAWHGVVPEPLPARRRRGRADPRPAVRRDPRLRGRPAARPRAAGRPRRRPLGARPGVVGYVAGRMRHARRASSGPAGASVVATVAASSFLGTSIFALSGLSCRTRSCRCRRCCEVILVAWSGTCC
jgi:hypothetical protein